MAAGQTMEAKTFRKNVYLHPDIHKAVGHRANEEGISRQEVVHRILCEEFGRKDLLSRPTETVTSKASA